MDEIWRVSAMVPPGGKGPTQLPGSKGNHVRVELSLSAHDLGTDPPPSRCHLRAYKVSSGWILLVWSPHGPTDAIRAWARAHTVSSEIGFGEMGERTVGLQCEDLPSGWASLFGLFDAHHLIMEPDGTALTRIEGSREMVAEFLGGLELEVQTESVHTLPDEDERMRGDVLTQRQEEALARASALGYFEVPRRIQLDRLADQLGTSPSALSELLRRAQGRLVAKYLDNQLGGLEAVMDFEGDDA